MVSNDFQRLISNKDLFNVEDGKLKILGIYGRINTVLTLVIQDLFLEKNIGAKKTRDLLYLLGESQTYHAIKMLVQKRGMTKEGKELAIVKETMGQSEFMGFGQCKVIKFDLDKKQAIVILENSSYLDVANSLPKMNKRIDNFTRGMFGGVLKFVFDEDVVTKAERLAEPTKTKYTIYSKREVDELKKTDESWLDFIPAEDIDTSDLDLFSLKNFLA